MKIIVQESTGGPETFQLTERADPTPDEGELVIVSAAAGVNPIDHLTAAGILNIGNIPLPMTVGWDVAGTVAAVGSGVTDFAVGDRVMGMPSFPKQAAAYATHVVAKATEVAKTPASMSDTEAGALPLAGLTAWQALVSIGGVKEGDKVLIHSGAGGVGHLAVQIAKARGAHVTATASAGKIDVVKSLGADVVLDYTKDALGEGYDVILDPQGGAQAEKSVAMVKEGGQVIALLFPTEEAKTAAAVKNVTLTMHMVYPDGPGMKSMGDLFEAGKLKIIVAKTFPLKEAADAQAFLNSSRPVGKVVIIPQA